MTPTPEQQAIIEAARSSHDNLLINALAGSAKTTTLELVCNALTTIPILSLAFNRRIADEMKKRLPGHVEVRTLNSLGHSVWQQTVGKRLTVDTGKMYGILKGVIDDQPRNRQGELRSNMSDILKWLRFAKRDGHIPDKWRRTGNPIYDGFSDWLARYDEEPDPEHRDIIDACLSRSIEAAYAGNIDFDDQVFMPVIFGGSWPKYPLVCVDEAQDLSPLNHAMLEKLVHQRLIAVGDPWQSIYAFRGSVSNGMQVMRDRWNMRELSLSVTFRVPKRGVERARFRVPHMQWFESAKDGHIEELNYWNADSIPDGAAIICRNNAPLFSAALKLLKNGRHIKLVGMDIGASLVRLLKKLGPTTLNESQMNDAILSWMKTELKRAKREETVYERAECLQVLVAGHHDLNSAIISAEALFKREGPIQLLSGHKAKGLEWDTVYHLDPWRIPSKFAKPDSEEMEQEMNVRYVIETRFKKEMYLINMEGFDG